MDMTDIALRVLLILVLLGLLFIAGHHFALACERHAELREIRKAAREEARQMKWLVQFERRQESNHG